jgi:hypothetical protein
MFGKTMRKCSVAEDVVALAQSMSPRPKRKWPKPIKVCCEGGRRSELQAKARAAGLSLPAYLSAVGVGYPVKSVVDHQRIEQLLKD